MTKLFYDTAAMLTEKATGLDGSHLKLWEVYEYIITLEQIKDVMNYTCLGILTASAIIITVCAYK